MKQEYLTEKRCIKNISEDLEVKNIVYESYNLENTEIYITTFSSKNDNEETAIRLSKLNLKIISEFDPIVLSNESSEYFNKRLFPLINDFERNLRKLLYLISSINSSVDGANNIQNLENLDLGEIFEILFTDKEFNKEVKKTINAKSWMFTQSEIIQTLHNLTENTLWVNLLGNDKISVLVQNFRNIKDIRNSVMHAHNTNHEHYKNAKKLYKELNKELDNEIRTILGEQKIENEDIEKSSQFNIAISRAIENKEIFYNSLSDLSKYEKLVSSISSALPELSYLNEIVHKNETLGRLNDLSEQLTLQASYLKKFQKSLDQLSTKTKDE